jgi:aminoglycoside phosphotransferase (APT) family kinase protein
MTPAELTPRLTAFLRRETGDATVAVEGVHKLAGGASREIFGFDLIGADGARRALVLRRDPGPSAFQDGARVDEYAVLGAAARAGVPVPAVLWRDTEAEVLGTPFFIMERVAGETLARRLLRDDDYAAARRDMTAQLGRALARLHAVDCDDLALPGTPPGETPAGAEVARYERLLEMLAPEPHPVLELALRWLATRIPRGARQTLVHGDYRIGNVIFGPEGLRAILDWELAHRGDPMEDLGWMCVKAWRFGGTRPVGGIGERADLFAAYEQAGGTRVDPERVRFWEVFGNLKWAVICIGQARSHLDGTRPSLELASLGRRTAEVEHELLALLD